MRTLTLVLFTTLIFFATASHAEDKNLEDLRAQMAEIQSTLKNLQELNEDLKNRLGSKENEIDGWRVALENIEAEIAALESGE